VKKPGILGMGFLF